MPDFEKFRFVTLSGIHRESKSNLFIGKFEKLPILSDQIKTRSNRESFFENIFISEICSTYETNLTVDLLTSRAFERVA